MKTRRHILELGSSALAGAALSACGGSIAAETTPMKPAFVLVHGAWHGAWAFGKLIPELSALGYAAVAVDLPGHGLDVQLPTSYLQRPVNPAAFATDPSPVSGVTVDQCADRVTQVIDQLLAAGFPGVILVGHSLGGITITRVAERAPKKVTALVYLTALMLPHGQTVLEATSLTENAAATLPQLFIGDPAVTGAVRIDPNSADPAYREIARSTLVNNELTPTQFSAMANLLTPDVPLPMGTDKTVRTVAGWGSVRRHFVKCLQDHAVTPALQQLLIDQADSFTPGNKTAVHSLNSSHSPFVTMPKVLAQELVKAAS